MVKYLKKYWLFVILAPIFMILEVTVDLLQPELMSKIIDEGVLGLSNNNVGDMGIVINTGIYMIGIVILGGIFGIACGVFTNICSQNFGNDLRKDAFSKIMELSFAETDDFTTGSLVTRVTNDITQVQHLVAQCMRGFVRTAMFLIGGTIFMLRLNMSFGYVVACALPPVILCVVISIRKANPKFFLVQKKLDHVNNVMQENIAGARVVKAYVKEDYEKKRFYSANDDLVGTQLGVLKLFAYFSPFINMALNITVVIVIYVGSIQVKAGTVTPGNVVAGITYASLILSKIMMLSNIFQTISRGNASASRINELLSSKSTIQDGKSLEYLYDITKEKNDLVEDKSLQKYGKVEFKQVTFAYPDNPSEIILDDISFTIEPGETVGIIGATGCGKSSLVNLIPRFYDVTSGSVEIDGVDVKEYQLIELRKYISIALQKSELFRTSVRENIKWGDSSATDEEMMEAAKIAQAHDFIMEKEGEYDALVMERGTSLSGGQKQRIAISRAILKKSNILIFDDSTSALDLKTEAKLYGQLKKYKEGVTKLIIAQRIASVKDADRILVLDNGKVVAFDSHIKLLEESEVYQDIYNSQLKNGGTLHE